MKKMRYMQLIILLAIIACAPPITTVGVGTLDAIPKASYTMYAYAAPSAPQLKAVFLKSPDAAVEVVPYSVQIITAAATPEEALALIEKGPGFKRIFFQRVDLRGKTIGYLLVPERYSFARHYIEVNLYEREGKVYFVPFEKGVDD